MNDMEFIVMLFLNDGFCIFLMEICNKNNLYGI